METAAGRANVKSMWNLAVAVCIGAVAGFYFGQRMHDGGEVAKPLREAAKPAAQQAALPPGAEIVYKVAVGTSPVKGDPEAKVTIVEFSDFQCPYCGRAIPVLKQVESRYGKDVRVAFKHNPLPMHPDAPYAARAAIAAAKQGKFWQMHDKLFEPHHEASENGFKPEARDARVRDVGRGLDGLHRGDESREAKDAVDADQG